MSKYTRAIEQLSEAKLIVSDVQRLLDDMDMYDIIDILNQITGFQEKLKKRERW